MIVPKVRRVYRRMDCRERRFPCKDPQCPVCAGKRSAMDKARLKALRDVERAERLAKPTVWRCPCDPRQLHKAGEACQCGNLPGWATPTEAA